MHNKCTRVNRVHPETILANQNNLFHFSNPDTARLLASGDFNLGKTGVNKKKKKKKEEQGWPRQRTASPLRSSRGPLIIPLTFAPPKQGRKRFMRSKPAQRLTGVTSQLCHVMARLRKTTSRGSYVRRNQRNSEGLLPLFATERFR